MLRPAEPESAIFYEKCCANPRPFVGGDVGARNNSRARGRVFLVFHAAFWHERQPESVSGPSPPAGCRTQVNSVFLVVIETSKQLRRVFMSTDLMAVHYGNAGQLGQVALLKKKLELECKLRGDFQALFDKLYSNTRRQLDGAISRQRSLLKTGDAAAFLANALGSVAGFVKKGFESLKHTGSALAELNKKVAVEAAQGLTKNAHGAASLAFESENLALNWLLQFMSPSYYVEAMGYGTIEMGFTRDDVLRDIKLQRTQTLARADRRIKATHQLLKAATSGLDLSTVA
jgi:hypothetical protein